MKIKVEDREISVMSNKGNIHGYFGWPTVTKLQNGKIAVVASGFRISHVCPFGKTVISYSEDNGETFTYPAPVIDTCLDDRDGGICPFGEKGVLVSSFNNKVQTQKDFIRDYAAYHTGGKVYDNYKNAYLDIISAEEEAKALGATYKISNDYGVTFGELKKSPISSPHGPIQIDEKTLLWVGRPFNADDDGSDRSNLQAYYMDFEGNMRLAGEIEKIISPEDKNEIAISCEPYAVLCRNGKIICHIRAHYKKGNGNVMTIYQTESEDSGKTWTKPHRITDGECEGPAHILKLSNGALVCSFGIRDGSYGVGVMFSFDSGETWINKTVLYDSKGISNDLGYPSTIELDDGNFFTVFYAHIDSGKDAVILGKKWSVDFEN